MDFLPIFIDIKQQPCLVVGGGTVAHRKVALLLQAQACVHVVSPNLRPELEQNLAEQRITYRQGLFQPTDLDNKRLVFVATDDKETNAEVATEAKQRHILVNVVDSPDLCSFIMPSIVDRSPICCAISTGGRSPVLARLLRGKIEASLPAAYGQLAALVADFRDKVKEKLPSGQRRRFWENILQGRVAELVFSRQVDKAKQLLSDILSQENPSENKTMGEVYLIGGGPGDPDLLTFRALRLMQQADVVAYDRLVSKAVLELVRRDAEKIDVGKERDNHHVPQDEINALLANLAKQGKRVLRLKGGDPFIFGRGGEELETLMAEGIPFQVIPGITAAAGAACYAGIPLTHRDYAQSCVFVTGHLKDGTMNLNWDLLVQPQQTVVVYMGLLGLPMLCQELMRHGLPANKPIALIQQATTAKQRVFTGTLGTLPEIIRNSNIKPPSLIIIGDVVKLHKKLAWFNPSTL